MGLISALRSARRRRILERSPIDEGLWSRTLRELPLFSRLNPADAARLRDLATIFLGEKTFHPVQGAVPDDRLKTAVAAQACLPLLGLDMDWYSDWSTIIVTPRGYEVRNRDVDEAGVVHEYDEDFAGEVLHLGPVVLSIADIRASGRCDGYNVVIHEMAHKIDGRDGPFDGCPPLHEDMDPTAWRRAFRAAYEDLLERIEGARNRRPAPIDEYAARSPDEFFAVVCEYFYEKPFLLRAEYPDVFEQLVLFFRRNPAGN